MSQGAANAPPQGVNPPAAPPAVQFALVPGDSQDVIDYSTKAGISLFGQATRSLYEDSGDLFNVDSAGLQTFLALLQHRGNTCGWNFNIPQDNNQPTVNLRNLLTHHGQFTMEHLTTYAQNNLHQQTRTAQVNMQIVKCILSSLSMPGFRKIQTLHDTWHQIHGASTIPAYPLLIKVIIREAFIDTQATT